MTDTVLDLLKYVLLALLYLFFARVLWAVWSEVRTPQPSAAGRSSAGPEAAADAPNARSSAAPATSTAPAPSATISRPRTAIPAGHLGALEPEHLQGRTWPLDPEITIGRQAGCTITLADDGFVSGRHARVFVLDGQPMVEDLDSTNGTYHNGERFGGVRLLRAGDQIRIGAAVLEVG